MLGLLTSILLAFITVDTLSNVTRVKIYNQVGSVKVIPSDTPFVKIREYSNDTTVRVFEIRKKNRGKTFILETKPRMSCSACGTDVIFGADSLENLSVEVTSGNIEVKSKVNKLSLSIMSGNAFLEGNFNRLNAEVLSGNLKISIKKADTFDISVSNGNITAILNSIVNYGKISVLMGNIRIHIPQNQALNAILSQKQDTITRNGRGNLEVKVTSGNLKIIENE